MPDYEELVEVSIREATEIVGATMAVATARSVDGLTVDDDGSVTGLDGDGAAILGELVDQYTERIGDVPRKSIAKTVQRRYDYIDVDLPENLADAMETAPVDKVTDELDDGILVFDTDELLIDVNPAAEEILGRDSRDLLGEDVRDVLPEADRILADDPDDEQPVPEEIEDAAPVDPGTSDGGIPDLLTLEVDGDERHYDARVSPLHDPQGLEAGSAVVLRDVTLREYHRRKLAERTEELKRKNRRLEEFTDFVSHDLRNPLNVAQGYVDLAKQTADAETAIEKIGPTLDRMEALIEGLLSMARQGEEVADLHAVAIDEVSRAAWSMVETSDATLDVTSGRELMADEDRLRQVLENLFRNAVEHGGAGVTVRVGLLPGEDSPDGFYVEDDGEGIPEGEREDVLELGYTTSDGGTGLGLGIIRQIVEGHGWEVAVTEGTDGGARFDVTGVEFVD